MMHYFIGVILLLILIIALPTKVLLAILAFFVISALIVQTSATFVTKNKIPFSKSIKAVIYALGFTVLAFGLTFQLVGMTASPVILLLPVLIFLGQAMAYSIALEVPFSGGAIISLCVMVVGWVMQLLFGLTASTVFKMMS
jgi:hypothetical protein